MNFRTKLLEPFGLLLEAEGADVRDLDVENLRELFQRVGFLVLRGFCDLGGADDESNMAPAHLDCHKGKSNIDARNLAKVRRIHAKHIGAQARPRNLIPGSRGTKFKRKLNGETVPR